MSQTIYVKGNSCEQKVASRVFFKLELKMTTTPILSLHDFNKIFEVDCDASKFKIGGTLSKVYHIAFFGKKIK